MSNLNYLKKMKTKLKIIQEKDAAALYTLVQNNKSKFIRWFPVTVKNTETLQNTKNYIEGLCSKIKNKIMYSFGIFHEEELIGMILIKAIDWRIPKCELAYYLDENYHGKGITTKMIQTTIQYCFNELKMLKIFLRIAPQNIASRRIAEKNGFMKEGVLRKEFKIETGEIIDIEYYGLINE